MHKVDPNGLAVAFQLGRKRFAGGNRPVQRGGNRRFQGEERRPPRRYPADQAADVNQPQSFDDSDFNGGRRRFNQAASVREAASFF